MNSVILIVLDGFGIAPPGPGNAIYLSNSTFINGLFSTYPNTLLKASGEAVGLPQGEVGNTEVGHLNLGAGRIVYQDLPRINMSIADGSFYKNQSFLDCVNHVKKYDSKLHLMGLVSDGIVHSSIDHLWSLLYFAKENQIKNVFIHPFTDGRDSTPKSALGVIKTIEEKTTQLGVGKIASISGRYYAMDRDNRWERTGKAYACLTKGEGVKSDSPAHAIEASYKTEITDEFILPTNICENNQPVALVGPRDSIIFFNYRIDRAKQLTETFVLDNMEPNSSVFQRGNKIEDLFFVTMTEYKRHLPVRVAFSPIVVNNPVGRVFEDNELPQLRLAESEKERFVTFYFNGQREVPFKLEDRIIIPSPKVATYDQKPEMSAFELTNTLITKINENIYPFILLNFANADMVGHTGNIQATIMAIKTLNQCLEKIVSEVLKNDLTLLITGDHGNAEQKINPQTGEISTEHTASPVPFIAVSNKFKDHFVKLPQGILADVSPTILSLLNISKPDSMTGRNLLEELQRS